MGRLTRIDVALSMPRTALAYCIRLHIVGRQRPRNEPRKRRKF